MGSAAANSALVRRSVQRRVADLPTVGGRELECGSDAVRQHGTVWYGNVRKVPQPSCVLLSACDVPPAGHHHDRLLYRQG